MNILEPSPPLDVIINSQEHASNLGEDEKNWLRTTLSSSTFFAAKTTLIHPDSPLTQPKFLLSGWAMEICVLPSARIQVIDFALPGELLTCAWNDPSPPLSTHVALTGVKLSTGNLLSNETALAKIQTAAELDRKRRQFAKIAALGQSAEERLACLLADLYGRLSGIGLVRNMTFDLPVTQEVMANAIGISNVHVNRVLQKLRSSKIIELHHGQLTILDPEKIRHFCTLPAR